ncbi:hypothetical protein PspS35_22900 [Pseudomonas sp. S35]|nr:hypothetical protein PspS35_22900 [Pseudomonas sp. S35]
MVGMVIAGHMPLAPFLIASAIAFSSVFLMLGILLATVLFIAGPIGFSQADSLLTWCLAMFVFTLGEMIIYPSEYLFIDTIAPDALRGSYYGAQNLTAVGGTLCFLSGRRVAGSC